MEWLMMFGIINKSCCPFQIPLTIPRVQGEALVAVGGDPPLI
jgi:hypothetical protein